MKSSVKLVKIHRLIIIEELLAGVCSDLHHLGLDGVLHVRVGDHGVGEDDPPRGAVVILNFL